MSEAEMAGDEVPFNRPFRSGSETRHIERAIDLMHLSSGGSYTAACEEWLQSRAGTQKAILTHSGTAALELAALLAEVGPGDEIVMPSFTFSTTASAFALRGATPVFVDIRDDTLTIDPDAVAAAISPSTKALVPVHYAGVACDIDPLLEIARDQGALVIEDAAQGLMARSSSRALGTFGELGAVSFHETKNVTCGEGGALFVNDEAMVERAEVIRDKGTNRKAFDRGEVDRYTWIDVGSSFAMSDLAAAFLWGQLEQAEEITADRLRTWTRYHEAFEPLESSGLVQRPVVPEGCEHNAHSYYLLARDGAERDRLLASLGRAGVNAVFHYVPLHSSPAGRRWGRASGELPVTDAVSARLLRLPLWAGMPDDAVERVIREVHRACTSGVPVAP
jgi:dTDP-4-amino-4,6-dideoxygalactose transaminase